MRARIVGLSLVAVAAWLPACPANDLQGECVSGFDYTDDAQLVPSVSPFVFCPRSPSAVLNQAHGSIILNNCGRQDLEIESFEITHDSGAEVFADLDIKPTTVRPGETAALRFTYTAVDLLEHRGKINIKSNDPKYDPFVIPIAVLAADAIEDTDCDPVTAPVADAGPGEDAN